jgi:hypothetical protein
MKYQRKWGLILVFGWQKFIFFKLKIMPALNNFSLLLGSFLFF